MTATRVIYGTAWKNSRTAPLVVAAVLQGFRAIDTACQLKHYREDLVGQALSTLQSEHGIRREDIFLQTKLTSIAGQDTSKPLPYSPTDPVPKQVRASFKTSLKNLRTTYLDSYLLHSPLPTLRETLEAWTTLMALQDGGHVRCIGISNVYSVDILRTLEEGGRRPQIVQNRWHEGNGFDRAVVKYCVEHEIEYQSFWTLTGSPSLLAHTYLREIAELADCTPEQALFKIVQSNGISPLSGTTSEDHMRQDLAVTGLNFTSEAVMKRVAAVEEALFS
ncbi:NADP-dependent oxidoreductase domain-containing protein [Schizophyllum amplum]|uniref:NADP-dependent oxidoreductase domain-containing protein n=1 Tax=Schizophyllum amplum TaxID=97359 RepID=A0A550C299_9AGAR|nr:NADP-dependent oxidoreductase domain-containing protein [Auriculariopsis ampla]